MENEDFSHEIEVNNFYFKEAALKIDGFKDALLEQFKALPLLAKYNLYCKDVPNHAEIVDTFQRNKPVNSETEAETQLNEIRYKFNDLASSKKLDPKYYGHYLANAPLINTLQEIEAKISEFEKYISKKVTRDNDVSFAAAFANKLILLTDKLGFPSLKAAIINEFINENENTDINIQDIMNLIDGVSNVDSRHLKSDYGNLKDYADSELSRHLKEGNQKILRNTDVSNAKPNLFFEHNLTKLHALCIEEKIFNEDYRVSDFINCFDLNYTDKEFPQLLDKPKFCFILSQIEAVNEKIAIECFNVKGFKTQKRREIEKRERITPTNKLFGFTNKVTRLMTT